MHQLEKAFAKTKNLQLQSDHGVGIKTGTVARDLILIIPSGLLTEYPIQIECYFKLSQAQ